MRGFDENLQNLVTLLESFELKTLKAKVLDPLSKIHSYRSR